MSSLGSSRAAHREGIDFTAPTSRKPQCSGNLLAPQNAGRGASADDAIGRGSVPWSQTGAGSVRPLNRFGADAVDLSYVPPARPFFQMYVTAR